MNEYAINNKKKKKIENEITTNNFYSSQFLYSSLNIAWIKNSFQGNKNLTRHVP